jgi:spore germination cell wall hydrolase CwlJ-like protein
MRRAERARPVLAQRRHRLRKRYAAIAVAIALPVMAGATNWGAANTPANDAQPRATIQSTTVKTLPQSASLGDNSLVHSDAADSTTSFAGEATSPGPAARAFLSSGSWLDRARAERCLTMAIYYEAATQPENGQRAVAQVVLNRVAHPSFPNTVCGVVFQGSERSTGCQFTFACDGSLARKPAPYWWDRARRVAQEALSGEVYAPVGLATHYHTVDVHPAWDDMMQRVATIGAHVFYRMPGPAGEKAAFHVAYLGDEPMAVPHPKTFAPAPMANDNPLALARAYAASLAPSSGELVAHHGLTEVRAASQPAYSEAIQVRVGDDQFRGGNLPTGGTLSPELQRSGQWLDRQ